MVRYIVDYSDLPHTPISDIQYQSNMIHQIGDPSILSNTPVKELEDIIDSATTNDGCDLPSYIPIVDDDYRVSFCRATNDLPELCQVKIWNMVRTMNNVPNPPDAPRKGISPRMMGFMGRWAARRKLEF